MTKFERDWYFLSFTILFMIEKHANAPLRDHE